MIDAIKVFRLALSATLFSALVVGCAVGTDSDPNAQEERAEEPELSAQGTGVFTETLYFSNAAHTTQVGRCVFSSCPPKGLRCFGQKTNYYEVYDDVCTY